MKNGMKIIRLVTAWLLLLPAVMAATTTLDQAAEGKIVTIPYLRVGEVYVYDLVLTAEERGIDLLVEDAFTIEVGTPRAHSLDTGDVFQVLPITYTQAPLPQFGRIAPDDESEHRSGSKLTDMIDLHTGIVLERRSESFRDVYSPTPDGYRWTRVIDTSTERGLENGYAFPYDLRPGSPIQKPLERYVDNLLDIFGRDAPRREDGQVGGQFVTRIVREQSDSRSTTTTEPRVSCQLRLPSVEYRQNEWDNLKTGSAARVEQTTKIWVSGKHAFPVLQECHAVVTTTHDPGRSIDEVRMATILADHIPGGRSLDFQIAPWGGIPLVGPQAELAEPTEVPGSLRTSDVAIAYPLEDALIDLMTLPAAGDLAKWRSQANGNLRIKVAEYATNPEDSDGESLWDPQMPALPGFGPEPDPAAARPTWSFWLYDGGAGTLLVDLYRVVDDDGKTVESGIGRSNHLSSAFHLDDGRTPHPPAIPLRLLLDRWAADAGISDPEAWLNGPNGGFALEMVGNTQFAIGFPYTPRVNDGQTASGMQYRTSDGLVLKDWDRTRDTQTVAGPPPRNYDTSMNAAILIPHVEPPYAAAAGAGLLTVLVILVYFWDIILRFLTHWLGFPLYAKVHKDKALDNPRREEIHELVQGNPGLTVAEIRKRLALGHGTTMFHLATLEHVGLLSSVRVGRARQWFVPGQMDHSAREQTAVLHHAAVRRVYEAIMADPGIHQRALAERLGIQPASLRPHLNRLEGVGLVSTTMDGQTKRYRAFPTPAAHRNGPDWRPVETPA